MSEQEIDEAALRIEAEGYVNALRSFMLNNMSQMRAHDLLSLCGEITTVRQAMLGRINALAPINRSPVEVLTQILAHLIQHPFESCPVDYFRIIDSRSLIVASQVCRTWRAIALATPALWTILDSRWPLALIKVFLQRSQSMPLSLVVRQEQSRHAVPLNLSNFELHANRLIATLNSLVGRCGSSLRRLDLDIREGVEPTRPAHTYLQFSAPLLECFTLVSDSSRPMDPERLPIIFNQCVSSLKAIALYPVTSWIPGESFPRLTHLYLQFSHTSTWNIAADLMHMLSSAPALRFLQMSCVDALQPTFEGRPIPLPSLRNLCITGTSLTVALNTLEHFEYPADAVVHVTHAIGGVNATPEVELPNVKLPALCSRMEIYISMPVLRLMAQGSRQGALGISCSFFQPEYWAPILRLSSLHTMHSLSSITTLHLRISPQVILTDLLPYTPHLIELAVRFGDEDSSEVPIPVLGLGLALVLARPTEPQHALYSLLAGGEGWPMTCPELQVLSLEGGLSTLQPYYLIRVASARADAGCPIRWLSIRTMVGRWDSDVYLRNHENLKELLTANIQAFIAVIDIGRSGEDDDVCQFTMEGMGVDPELEKYWTLPRMDRPSYTV